MRRSGSKLWQSVVVLLLVLLVVGCDLLPNIAVSTTPQPTPQRYVLGGCVGKDERPLLHLNGGSLNSLSMVSADEGWAVGEAGLVHYKQGKWSLLPGAGGDLIQMISPDEGWMMGRAAYRYRDGCWMRDTEAPAPFQMVGQPFDKMYALSGDRVWAVGSCCNHVAAYEGGKWSRIGGLPVGDEYWQLANIEPKVHMLTAKSGWRANGAEMVRIAEGKETVVVSGLRDWPQSVFAVSADESWAVGDHGFIVHCMISQCRTVDSPTSGNLRSIKFVSADEGWAVGDAILHYKDGKWQEVEQLGRTILRDIQMVGNSGVAVGDSGTILQYDGQWWQKVASPTRQQLHSISLTAADEGWAVGTQGTLLHLNGGQWQVVTGPTNLSLFDVQMLSPSEGWAVGRGGIILHYKDGSWGYELAPVATDILSIHMVTTNEGWAVGGAILHYQNGRWSIVESLTDATLTGVQMLSADEGWAVGYYHMVSTGSTFEYPKPLLRHYKDGSWSEVESPVSELINGHETGNIFMLSRTEGWAAANALLHYKEGMWSKVANEGNYPSSPGFTSVWLHSAAEGWAVGDGMIFRYADGVWRLYQN